MAPELAERRIKHLRRECRTFTRYLISQDASPYIETKYVDLHIRAAGPASANESIDCVLNWLAVANPWGTKIADAYARVFRPHGPLRRKLILTFAILEHSGQHYANFTAGGRTWFGPAAIRIIGALAAFGLSLCAAVLIVTPLRLLPDHFWRHRPDV